MPDSDNLDSSEIVLGLDISTKTGFSVQRVSNQGCELLSYGLLGPFEKNNKQYPLDYYEWAHVVSSAIIAKIEEIKPDKIVIEETSKGSKNHLSQKILEYVHFCMVTYFVQMDIWPIMMQTGEWRHAVGAKMTKEEAKQNALVRKIKKETGSVVAKNEMGKRIGKKTKKHINVRIANELYHLKLKLKDNDLSDAILLCNAYWQYKHNNYKRNLKQK